MCNKKLAGPLELVVCVIIAIGLVTYSVGVAGFPGDPTKPTGDPTPQSSDDAIPEAINYVEGQLVVKLLSVDPTPIEEINSRYGTSTLNYLPCLGVYLLLAESRNPDDMEALAKVVRYLPGVADAHPNFLVAPMEPVQGSFAFPDESSSGSFIEQPAATTLRLPQAHSVATGANVKVAVIDGGIDYTHPAFDGMIVSAYDYVDNDYEAFDEPGGVASGHGTFIAGVIHLIAPDAEIRSYRVIDPAGASNGYVVAEAIMQAVVDGCRVVNLSLVAADVHGAIASAIEYAGDKNVTVVAAAGNGFGESSFYPACDPSVITVAAVDDNNVIAEFSSCGEHIDVCAPGVNIYAPFQDAGYAWWSGTSFAAPFTAGQAALFIEKHSDFCITQMVKDAIVETATDISSANPDLPGMIGSGLIDPYASLWWTPPSSNYMDVIYPGYHEVFVQSDSVISFFFHVLSMDLGAAYLITHHNEPVFLTIDEPSGYTPGPEPFTPNLTIDATGLEVGIYQDTVIVAVAGCDNSPQMHVITLNVVGDAIRFHVENHSIVVSANGGPPDTSYVLIESSNAPAQYSVQLTGPSAFLSLINTGGTTRNIKYDPAAAAQMDTAFFLVDAGSLAPGMYYDTLEVTVDGIDNGNPAMVLIQIQVIDEYTPYWSACPRWHFLDFEEGDDTVYSSSIRISSSNAPEPFYIWIPSADYWDGPEDSVLTWDSDSGLTNGEFQFNLHPNLKTANDNGYGVLVWICKDNKKQLASVRETAYISFRVWEPESGPLQPHPIVESSSDPVLSDIRNYPNPFNPETDIRFALSKPSQVKLSVYNVLGQNVITLHDGLLSAGVHSVQWNGRDSQGNSVASGIYIYRLQADDVTQTRKMVLLR